MMNDGFGSFFAAHRNFVSVRYVRSETIWQIKFGRLEQPLRLSKLPIALQSDDRPKRAQNDHWRTAV